MSDIKFHDNRRVWTQKWGAEFLAVTFQTPTDEYPYGVKLTRYGVPGRCDRYAFELVGRRMGGPLIRFRTDHRVTLVWAVAQVQKDLNRKNVAEMLRLSATEEWQHFARPLAESLLSSIAPKSLSLKVMRKELKGLEAAQMAAIKPK